MRTIRLAFQPLEGDFLTVKAVMFARLRLMGALYVGFVFACLVVLALTAALR